MATLSLVYGQKIIESHLEWKYNGLAYTELWIY
jgi:hypothetical protein